MSGERPLPLFRAGAAGRLAVVACVALLLAACQSELYSNLDERQANEIIATLQRHGIAAGRAIDKEGRITVSVGGDDFARAFDILRDNGLPRRAHATLGEVFKAEGLVASPIQERARMTFAMSEELSRTLDEIDGVLSARVHLVLPETSPFSQTTAPSSASVLLRYRAGASMAEYVPQIKTLVANAVAGLTYDGVSVVLVPVQLQEETLADAAPVSFLGLWLRPDSLSRAHWLFMIAAGLIALLAVAVGLLVWSSRSRVYAVGGGRRRGAGGEGEASVQQGAPMEAT